MTTPTLIPLRSEQFTGEVDGQPTALHTLQNKRGMTVRFTSLGAKLLQIIVPDASGKPGDVALGYESLAQVQGGQTSMGAFIGRYAGRINAGRFSLDGTPYQLTQNNGGNSLHGGVKGSRFRVFEVRQLDAASAELRLNYADGEEGFPGEVHTRVIYRVTEDNELSIEYEAHALQTSIVNFTSHIFFNLAGTGRVTRETMENHLLQINAQAFTPIDTRLIPSGEIRPVADTPLDFRQPTRIGKRSDDPYEQIAITRGYDHNWVLDKPLGEYALAGTLQDPLSGRRMEVWSTEPGLVVYGCGNLTGEAPRDIGKGGEAYGYRSGICLEPGHFADSPNHPNFPSTRLGAGERYSGRICYRFSA